MEVKFTGNEPTYKHATDAAADLIAAKEMIVNPGEFAAIPTGTCLEIPNGYYGSVQSRSGLAKNKGIFVLTGTIDSGFRGEILVILGNFGKEPFEIQEGYRIAQLLILKCNQVDFVEADELSDSDRGTDGYGSTGIK